MSNKNQLTITDEVIRKEWLKQQTCKHRFGKPHPAFDFNNDAVYYFSLCDKCGIEAE